MHSLRKDGITRAQYASPAEKLAEAFQMMRFGMRLKRMALKNAHPCASEEEIEALFERWLFEP